jgi:hypothetical protein
MSGRLFDRLTDGAGFAVLLAISGVIVLPILFLGLVLLLPMLVLDLAAHGADAETLALATLPLGGVIGVVGLLRARWGTARPERHNVTATLIFLAIGAITAAAVGGLVLVEALVQARTFGSPQPLLSVLFASANAVWIVSGIAAVRRLARRLAERTGEAIDAVPVLLLLVVLVLAWTVVLVTAANA